jgi:hypothetical protein
MQPDYQTIFEFVQKSGILQKLERKHLITSEAQVNLIRFRQRKRRYHQLTFDYRRCWLI